MSVDLESKAHFGNYNPYSFGWKIEPNLVPFTFKGVNFGQCAAEVHDIFIALLTELEPIIPGGIAFGPHDDWAYSSTDELPDGSPSFHHFGIAFDLNWRENPMGNYANNPDASQKGAIPTQKAIAIARKYGCEYGASWSGGPNRLGFKDYMHFECHLDRSVAKAFKFVPPAPVDPFLETIMALYANRAEFETALRAIVHDEVAQRGVRVAYINGNDNNDSDPSTRDAHLPETLFSGVPGYKTVAEREVPPVPTKK